MSLQPILDDCGLTIIRYERVHGGDINHSYCLYSPDAKYFLKTNDAKLYPGMFDKEATGLNSLRNNSSIIIPEVIKSGVLQQQQYLLLEWIVPGKPSKNFWQNFGAGLATMHQQAQSYFGWKENNYIGSLPQYNSKNYSWPFFYAQYRILSLVKMLFNTGSFETQDVRAAESFCKKSDQLFPPEPPALLHGDLWSGNFMITATGDAAMYDPAVYYGHREMDIGMTKLFSGFHQHFYNAYNDVYPLEKEWTQRLPLTHLYPLLVHAVLFGGHYVWSARNIIKQFAG